MQLLLTLLHFPLSFASLLLTYRAYSCIFVARGITRGKLVITSWPRVVRLRLRLSVRRCIRAQAKPLPV